MYKFSETSMGGVSIINRVKYALGIKEIRNEGDYMYCTLQDGVKDKLKFDNIYARWLKEIYSLICYIGEERECHLPTGMQIYDSKYEFFGTAESVADQLFYFFVKDSLSEKDSNNGLDILCYQILFHDEEWLCVENNIYAELVYIQMENFVKKLITQEFNTIIQGEFYDFFVSFWSCFESCIGRICKPYEEEIKKQLNDSQMKKMKKFLSEIYNSHLNKEEIEEKLDNEKEKFNKLFGGYVSFNDKYTYLMKKVLGEDYTRDTKADCRFLEFCGALRNTLHNNGKHLKADKEIKVENVVFRLEKEKKLYLDDFAHILILARELFNIYIAIIEGLDRKASV